MDLVVTSPPYPMIAMWDDTFTCLAPESRAALDEDDGPAACEAMHRVLDVVWAECARVLRPGGIACINIGDAVRTVGGAFRMYSNHARIISAFQALGLHPLPAIIWRKQTNAPNKFMGSGMLPAGAYVTLEHEFILVFRKGGKREFKGADTARRRASAFFWEERNTWFSDVWFDLKGASQKLCDKAARARSGAFPLELPWRLIHMFSVQGDTVLDPFLGTGTTLAAAAAAARNSVGYESDASLGPVIRETALASLPAGNARLEQRLRAHREFVRQRLEQGKELKHTVAAYDLPCISKQESGIVFQRMKQIKEVGDFKFRATYQAAPGGDTPNQGHQAELF